MTPGYMGSDLSLLVSRLEDLVLSQKKDTGEVILPSFRSGIAYKRITSFRYRLRWSKAFFANFHLQRRGKATSARFLRPRPPRGRRLVACQRSSSNSRKPSSGPCFTPRPLLDSDCDDRKAVSCTDLPAAERPSWPRPLPRPAASRLSRRRLPPYSRRTWVTLRRPSPLSFRRPDRLHLPSCL